MRLSFIAIAILFLTGPFIQAQSCGGFSSITESVALVYSPIARAARVQGTVIMLTTFCTDGKVESSKVISGPVMLRRSAMDFVSGWKANAYSGPRTCPVVIRYFIAQPDYNGPSQRREDLQHVSIYAMPLILDSQYSAMATRQ
jgi:hypothetical protein